MDYVQIYSLLDGLVKSMILVLKSTQLFTLICLKFKMHFMLIQLLHHQSGKHAGIDTNTR